MDADAIIIGTPIFQASIPAALKNVFDLLPTSAFLDKVVGVIATAGSSKHYLIPAQHLLPILTLHEGAGRPAVCVRRRERPAPRRDRQPRRPPAPRPSRRRTPIVLTRTFASIREERDAAYGF
jgi:FMN reductase